MVPVGMADQDGDADGLVFEFLGEGQAEAADACAGVEDDDFVVGAEFDAGGITAVDDGAGARGGDGASDAPEADVGLPFIRDGRGGGGCWGWGGFDGDFGSELGILFTFDDMDEVFGQEGFDEVTVGAGFFGILAVG
ncbi:MAG: hypothetical protein RI897_1900 [Verrucomicrobiota bacterium]